MSQTLPDWIGSRRRAFEYFDCVPRGLVPDNLNSGVNKASKYEPELNPTYTEFDLVLVARLLIAEVVKPGYG